MIDEQGRERGGECERMICACVCWWVHRGCVSPVRQWSVTCVYTLSHGEHRLKGYAVLQRCCKDTR